MRTVPFALVVALVLAAVPALALQRGTSATGVDHVPGGVGERAPGATPPNPYGGDQPVRKP